ncbi:MAG: hypothetical protein CUN55_00480 [Phototrophicales bacterium]|nr:MAG: hypothetical protein CUN55_00480 [Phototrophicales bacterium]
MARKYYNKLIRDKVPERILEHEKLFSSEFVNEEEYERLLRLKVVEEAQEVADSGEGDLISEIADVYEVLDSLLSLHGIDKSEVLQVQQRRREELGSFNNRVKLLWVSK